MGQERQDLPADGATPYRRDLKNGTHLLDTGHFALETHGEEMASSHQKVPSHQNKIARFRIECSRTLQAGHRAGLRSNGNVIGSRFGSLVFTPAVKALQERYGSRKQYARFEEIPAAHPMASPLGSGRRNASFYGERDSFLHGKPRGNRLAVRAASRWAKGLSQSNR